MRKRCQTAFELEFFTQFLTASIGYENWLLIKGCIKLFHNLIDQIWSISNTWANWSQLIERKTRSINRPIDNIWAFELNRFIRWIQISIVR